MAFFNKENRCDNCGKDLDGVDDVLTDDTETHEFCSADCQKEYETEHEHEEEESEEICQFC